jgi:hypothetical protein
LIDLVEKNTQTVKMNKLKDIKKINLKVEKLDNEEVKKLSVILFTNTLENKTLTTLILEKIKELELEYDIATSDNITNFLTLEKDYDFNYIHELINYYK